MKNKITDIPELLTDRQVATRLGCGVSTLRRWRLAGSGPPFRKIGGRLVRYTSTDVLQWIEASAPPVCSTTAADALRRKRVREQRNTA